ncbi:LacI family DNA-binding transcriptional regulator [Dinghuibacter silviterrae]|uniref:LacI family transcriptional regulator n=1 Tax=Dinghuibacter silviterrae TaxID=1539049 RepID=A0A4R8DW18_9BACT|nr:LacI family DNA-binding transcriptional regulator [Dinghuibacter silviterrae]TDX01597.1 LacI family transcriptional regulator [Dinghuibacter silviterrae]
MRTITLKMLAAELRLSPGTVSKALKGSHEISEATREKVMDMARRLDYVPNPYASSLRRRTSKTIGVVLPAMADSFFSMTIEGIEAVAGDKGYHVLIYLSHESYYKEAAIVKDFQSGRVDGVLISLSGETWNTDHLHTLTDKNIPVVYFDRVCEENDVARIATDDMEAGFAAASHLLEAGCKRLLFLSPSDNLAIIKRRLAGCRKAAPGIASLLCIGDLHQQHLRIREALAMPDRPDGIIASVESLGYATYQACTSLGLEIPSDVKVVAFSNMPTASLLHPSLTTVEQPAFEIGKTAATVLFKGIEKGYNHLSEESRMIPSVLVPRGSTAKA